MWSASLGRYTHAILAAVVCIFKVASSPAVRKAKQKQVFDDRDSVGNCYLVYDFYDDGFVMTCNNDPSELFHYWDLDTIIETKTNIYFKYNGGDGCIIIKENCFPNMCDDNTGHDTYAYYDDDHELFVQSDIEGLEKPFSYEVADYDSDGSNELLIANMGHGFNDYDANGAEDKDEGFSTIKLQMYELESGSVKLQAEKLCIIQDSWSAWYYHNIPAFATTLSGGTDIYRYQQNDEQIIAVEARYLAAAFSDGVNITFMAFKYDGQSWIDVGEAWYVGSDISEDEIESIQKQFSAMGLNVDFEEMFFGGKRIIDYIDNPILIGRSNCEIFYDDISDMWQNPNLLYKIGRVSFARR